MLRTLTTLLTALAVLGAAWALAPTDAAAGEAAACTVELTLEGMVCPSGCPPVIKEQLAKVDGVLAVTVTFETRTAAVTARAPLCDKEGARKLVGAVKSPFRAAVKRIVPAVVPPKS
jgi:copper chaperone CopZ